MAAIAAVNRPPPAHPGPNAGNQHSHPNSGVPDSGQQDPGLYSTRQDPGPSSHPQHHISARPFFYIPAPPPPPLLHYHWPMPFSYNPFTGFPGMGYGMVMPPFPPPPYMEAPAYILPHSHPHIDYRRLLHPQVHAPSAPYQNPNHARRIRLPYTVPVIQTVNSEVQTESTQRGISGFEEGSPIISADSGHGTTSNSPYSSSSSSQKQGSAEVEDYTLPCSNTKDFQVNRNCTSSTVKHSFNIPQPTGKKTVQSCISATLETQKSCQNGVCHENVPPYRNGHCNMWSVGSQESMVPVCSSSQQEDEVVKERRISVPDILMSWRGGTPQAMSVKMAEKELPQNAHQLLSYKTEIEHEKSVYQSPTETKNGPVVTDNADANDGAEGILSSEDSETLFKILKCKRENEPFGMVGSVKHCLLNRDDPRYYLNDSHKLLDNEQENETKPHEDTTEIILHQLSLNGCHMKRKMNESVWSVESLAPFVPNQEWLQQNGMFEPEIIVEITEEVEKDRLSTQDDNIIVKSGKESWQTHRFSSSDSVPMSDSWLIFSTPAEKPSPSKKSEIEREIDTSGMRGNKQNQNMDPSKEDPSPTCLPSENILSSPAEEDVDKNGSFESEANQSPNKELLIIDGQQEKSTNSAEQEERLCLNSEAEEKISSADQLILQNGVHMEVKNGEGGNEEVNQLRNKQLCVPMADQTMAEVSPSKYKHLVDCGIQCTELQERNCLCEQLKNSMDPSTRHNFKHSDMKKVNTGKAEGFCMNEHIQKNHKRHSQWKNRGQEKQSSQQDSYNRYRGKPGKSKGGNERNPQY